MRTLPRMDKGVIKDYYYMKTMDENVNWLKPTHLLSKISRNLKASFCTSTFTLEFLLTYLNVHIEEYLSLMYNTYAYASNNTPSYTHVSLYMVWRVHPRGKRSHLFVVCNVNLFRIDHYIHIATTGSKNNA